MSRLYPDHRERIDLFLRRNGYPQWRAAALLKPKCGVVKLLRDGRRTPVTVTTPEIHVQEGDTIFISDPLPTPCQDALNNPPLNDFRDYAFAPKGGDFGMAEVFKQRKQTIIVPVDTLAAFCTAVSNEPVITHPIRHLFIASHANPEGLLKIELDGSVTEITYEHLEKACKSGIIRILTTSLTPRPKDKSGNAIPATLHIRGCRIGQKQAQPFLELFKTAIGGELKVTAPKHFHVTAHNRSPAGAVEYMKYGFSIYRPEPLKSRGDLIKAFALKEFLLLDGKTVVPEKWEDWIPKGTPLIGSNKVMTRVISPITGRPEPMEGEVRFKKRWYFDKKSAADKFVNLKSEPSNNKKKKEAVRSALIEQHASFRDGHLFPQFRRYGYSSMDEFMDGWNWNFRWQWSNNRLYFDPYRYEYVVIQPIVNPNTNVLYVNFYPTESTKKDALLMFEEDDTHFFSTV